MKIERLLSILNGLTINGLFELLGIIKVFTKDIVIF